MKKNESNRCSKYEEEMTAWLQYHIPNTFCKFILLLVLATLVVGFSIFQPPVKMVAYEVLDSQYLAVLLMGLMLLARLYLFSSYFFYFVCILEFGDVAMIILTFIFAVQFCGRFYSMEWEHLHHNGMLLVNVRCNILSVIKHEMTALKQPFKQITIHTHKHTENMQKKKRCTKRENNWIEIKGWQTIIISNEKKYIKTVRIGMSKDRVPS